MPVRSCSLLFLLLILAWTGIVESQSKNLESLRKERVSFEKTSDAVDRTKISVKISDILILLITDAARSGNTSLVDQYLNDYCKTIKDAEDTMIKTKKDAHKHPAGFKE